MLKKIDKGFYSFFDATLYLKHSIKREKQVSCYEKHLLIPFIG